jgi:hypothetical protein
MSVSHRSETWTEGAWMRFWTIRIAAAVVRENGGTTWNEGVEVKANRVEAAILIAVATVAVVLFVFVLSNGQLALAMGAPSP